MLQKSTVDFLKKLKKNNNREWFQKNKSVYEEAKADFEKFLNLLIIEISKFDKSLSGIQAKDCVFRIYRDVRFAKDKSPYKTNFGASLSKNKKEYFKPGYYIHIEPSGSFLAGGVWMPPADLINKIRQEIDYNTKEFKKIIGNKDFKNYFKALENQKLKKTPKNYPKDHPEIELLKYTSYIATHEMKENMLTDKKLLQHCAKTFKAMLPLNEFLRKAIE